MGRWDWSPPPFPKVTLTWIQYCIQSSCAGLLCQCPGDRDHSGSDLLHHVKWKGILEDVPICDSAFSNDATSSLKL